MKRLRMTNCLGETAELQFKKWKVIINWLGLDRTIKTLLMPTERGKEFSERAASSISPLSCSCTSCEFWRHQQDAGLYRRSVLILKVVVTLILSTSPTVLSKTTLSAELKLCFLRKKVYLLCIIYFFMWISIIMPTFFYQSKKKITLVYFNWICLFLFHRSLSLKLMSPWWLKTTLW